MLEALAYVHSMGLIHRDVKPENFLFSRENEKYLKLIDFGMCEKAENIRENGVWVGTFYYQSPEMVSQLAYDEKVDLWSLGVVLYLLFYQKLPFNNKRNNRMVIHQKIRTKHLSFLMPESRQHEQLASDFLRFISLLLERDVETRYTAQNALCWTNSPAMVALKVTNKKISYS
jgi:serine/threonine protein kinase